MPLSNKINTWFKKVKSSVLRYRKGFYEIPFIPNSPDVLVNSSSTFSFVKNHKDKNYLSTGNLFLKLELNYFKLEEDLWLLYSESLYKRNIKFIPHFDEDSVDANNYYMLSLNLCSNHNVLQIKDQKKKFKTDNYYWCLFKPNGHISTYNYKNSEAKYITLCFTKQWLQKNLANNEQYVNNGLQEFVNSNKPFILWPEVNENYHALFPKVKDYFLSYRVKGEMNLLSLKTAAYQLVNDFVELYHVQNLSTEDLHLNEEQRNLTQQVENYLQGNLAGKFDGIEVIANRFKISETKLKNDFKRLYGKPIYQYFNEHQMLLAKELLQTQKTPIKELAYTFGYETPGKFTEAFKKYIGVLPSEI